MIAAKVTRSVRPLRPSVSGSIYLLQPDFQGSGLVNTWLWGILSVVGTTALAGVTTRLVGWLFERSAPLVVRVTINKAFKSPLMFDHFSQLRKTLTMEERMDFSWKSYGKFRDYFNAEHYVHIGVRNNSNRKLSNLSFCAHSIGSAMLQVGDGEMIEVTADQPIPLGDLQPRREIILHLLAGRFGVHTHRKTSRRAWCSPQMNLEMSRISFRCRFIRRCAGGAS